MECSLGKQVGWKVPRQSKTNQRTEHSTAQQQLQVGHVFWQRPGRNTWTEKAAEGWPLDWTVYTVPPIRCSRIICSMAIKKNDFIKVCNIGNIKTNTMQRVWWMKRIWLQNSVLVNQVIVTKLNLKETPSLKVFFYITQWAFIFSQENTR